MPDTSTVRRSRRLALALVLAAAVVSVAGGLLWRGRAVAVELPAPPVDVAAVCERLAAALPALVEGQERRQTRPASPLVAAWGDPAIVSRCGVPRPAALQLDSEVVAVNGVEWFLEPTGDGYACTTEGRLAYVEVLVPRAYAPEVNPLVDLAEAITAAVPERPR